MAIRDFDGFAVVNLLPDTNGNDFNFFEKIDIVSYLRVAYNFSRTGQQMIDNWGSKPINITFRRGKAEADPGTGNIFIDLNYVDELSYVDTNGKAQQYSRIGAVIHELCHALTGRRDNITPTDYQGDNVRLTNQIWAEIRASNGTQAPRLREMRSYTATTVEYFQKKGYEYTDGASIGAAYNVEAARTFGFSAIFNRGTGLTDDDASSVSLGNSKDLLIGGQNPNKLYSGAGDDFLFGGGGNDTLNGGAGKDTAVYFGSRGDYDINKNKDGSFSISNKNESQGAGTDKLIGIEFAQFDGFFQKEIVDLKKVGKNDLALVFDTTGSMGAYVRGLQQDLQALFRNGVFANGNDGRAAIVLYKDTTIGEASTVLLPFTNQNNFADRESATIAAIDKLIDNVGYGYGTNKEYFGYQDGDLLGGGGDEAETPFDGLQLALSGYIGQWRTDAEALRIVLFTDASAKDYALASRVTALAKNIGATVVRNSSVVTRSGDSIDTFNLRLATNSSSSSGLVGVDESDPNSDLALMQSDNLSDADLTNTAQVQIFTVFVGSSRSDTAALEEISRNTGGAFLRGLSGNEWIEKIFETINTPQDQVPIVSIDVNAPDAAESGTLGQFNLTRTGTITQALTVNYTISGTATNITDYQNLTGTATFEAGSSQITIDLRPIDDKIYEGNETVILTLNDEPSNYQIDATSNIATFTIVDDDLPSIYLSVTDDKAAETNIGQPTNPGQFTIKRTGLTTESLSVNYSLNGTADNGIDYQFLETRITFAPESDMAIIDLQPLDNDLAQATKIVLLKLATSDNYTIDGAKSGTVKIADNDRVNDRDFNDLVLNVERPNDFNTRIGSGLQGEVIDLRDFERQVFKVDTVAMSDAGYNNYLGFYNVIDAQGTLASGLKVGDLGYAEAAIRSVVLHSFKTETQSDRSITGGGILAPVIIANGTFEDYLSSNPQNQANSDIHAYFNYLGANPDRIDHFRLLGENKFGAEDLYGGGDRDYNDIIFQMNIKN
jgi:Calx-beta domain/Domain of unknown function (DUF4114)/RTX calcium-binding nonapeptide repeat (4 copies)